MEKFIDEQRKRDELSTRLAAFGISAIIAVYLGVSVLYDQNTDHWLAVLLMNTFFLTGLVFRRS